MRFQSNFAAKKNDLVIRVETMNQQWKEVLDYLGMDFDQEKGISNNRKSPKKGFVPEEILPGNLTFSVNRKIYPMLSFNKNYV